MAILEKEVLIGFSNNLSHFESLGYVFPKTKGSKGNLVIKKGTKILVKTEDLPKSSNIRVTRICDDCGKITYNRTYSSILELRKSNDGKDRCRSCGNIRAKRIMKENIPYEKTLDFYCKENNLTHILDEYSEENAKKASEIFKATSDKVTWKCKNCNSKYKSTPANRTKGNNCPYCANKKVNETNNIWRTNPEIAKLLTYPDRGYELTYGTAKKESFSCPSCGFTQRKEVHTVNSMGFSCPKCSDGISYPEKLIFSLLDHLEVKTEKEKVFNWSRNVKSFGEKFNGKKRYDFYIPEFNIIVEAHGGQHYQRGFGHLGGLSLEEVKQNDDIKLNLALSNGITDYIIIDCRYSSLEYIKNNILNSRLTKYFDLSKVDWESCNRYSRGTHVKEVADLWNSGKKNKEISELLKINRATAIRYLKQSSELGWCDYNPKKEMTKKRRNYKLEKKIVQLTLEGDFIKEWESLASVSRSLGIATGNLARVCKGQYNSAKGYKWLYKEEYDLIHNKEAVAI